MGWEFLGIIVLVVVIVAVFGMFGLKALGMFVELFVDILAALFSSKD